MWHLQMRSQRRELLLILSCGVAFPKPLPCLGQNLQHCQLPKIILGEGGWTSPDLSQSDEAGQALPNWAA